MVDQSLMEAEQAFVGDIMELDLVPLFEGAAGLGLGLFSAEFVAELVGGALEGQRRAVRFLGEILAKAGLTGVFLFLRRMGGDLITVLLGLAATGSTVSALLQIIESVAETAARIARGEEIVGGAPEGEGGETASDSASIDESSWAPDAAADGGGNGGAAEYSM